MRVARWIFAIAGIYGLLVLIPLYRPLSLSEPGQEAIYRYGFAGAAAATEILYLFIATDVRRYRPLMLIGVMSKVSFALPASMLVAVGKLGPYMLILAAIDASLGIAFAVCWIRLRCDPPTA